MLSGVPRSRGVAENLPALSKLLLTRSVLSNKAAGLLFSQGGYTCTFTYSAQGGTNEVSQASLQMVPLPLGPVAAQNKKKNIQDICVDTGGDWEGCGCRDKRLLFCPKPRLVSHRPVPLV